MNSNQPKTAENAPPPYSSAAGHPSASEHVGYQQYPVYSAGASPQATNNTSKYQSDGYFNQNGYQPIPQASPSYGSYQNVSYQNPTYQQTYISTQPAVIIVGSGCPACRIGILENDFTLIGILLAIFFFPLGLIFCCLLRVKRCTHCGAVF